MNEEIEIQYKQFLQRGNTDGKSFEELKNMLDRMNLIEKKEFKKNNKELYKELIKRGKRQ